MTRFARAKGSKSSNERVPNEATPWHVMKEQLQDNAMLKNNQISKAKSAKELLKEKDELFYHDSAGNVNNEWAEFQIAKRQTNSVKKKKPAMLPEASADSEKRKKSCEPRTTEGRREPCMADDDNLQTPRKSKKHVNIPEIEVSRNDSCTFETSAIDNLESKDVRKALEGSEKMKKRKKNKNIDLPKSEEKDPVSKSNTNSGKVSKRHKRNQKRIQKKAEEKAKLEGITTEPTAAFDAEISENVSENVSTKNLKNSSNLADFQNKAVKRKASKIRDDKEHKRRKPDTGSMRSVINGVEVIIVKYDGFPVKKEDSDRLKELRKKMTMKGIPKSEIDVAMKLERRKAEKALTRLKKQVCFHCRKAGHNLSDCPELGKEEVATGICFKCGSTEHTHFECRVTKKEEFRFASCFICREQGHIAKQCPDNPKGLYPQGGACKICGDVTHLRKDCPDLEREKEETTITVGTIAQNTLESLDDYSARTIVRDNDQKSKNKIVKF